MQPQLAVYDRGLQRTHIKGNQWLSEISFNVVYNKVY